MSNEFFDGMVVSPLEEEIASIGEEERNGILEVKNGEHRTRLHFRKGSLVRAQRPTLKTYEPLVEYLIYGRILSERDLEKAYRLASVKNVTLEEVLVSTSKVTEDLIVRFADLQKEEGLYPLFTLESPVLRWLDERPKREKYGTPLPAKWILKESRRRTEMWPRIAEEVGSEAAVFERDASRLAEVLGYGTSPVEEIESLGGNARMVFFHINGSRNVRQIARTAGLGLFQVHQALRELQDVGVVERIEEKSPGEPPPRSPSRMRKITLGLSYLIFLGLLGLGVEWGLNHGGTVREHLVSNYGQKTDRDPEEALFKLVRALELYELEFGHYPASLSELAELGYNVESTSGVPERYRLELHDRGYRLVLKDEAK